MIRKKVIIPTDFGDACFVTFSGLSDDREHLAIIYGLELSSEPFVRLHSECLTGDVFLSRKCDCGDQLKETIQVLSQCGGVLLYLRQEGRGIGLYNKLDAYELQSQGIGTFDADEMLGFPADSRSYNVAYQMLEDLGLKRIKLITNNPEKSRQLSDLGITIVRQISTSKFLKKSNSNYLHDKQKKAGHVFSNETILTESKLGLG